MFKSRTLEYRKLYPMSIFIYGKESYVKIGNSHAVNTRTGKDFIPALYDKVKVIGKANAQVPRQWWDK